MCRMQMHPGAVVAFLVEQCNNSCRLAPVIRAQERAESTGTDSSADRLSLFSMRARMVIRLSGLSSRLPRAAVLTASISM